MNKRQSPANGDSAVTLFGPGDYCALTNNLLVSLESKVLGGELDST